MTNDRALTDKLYQEFARIGKCLSSPKRLEILDLLSQSPKSVDGLAKDTGMTVANVSQHLQTLHHARLVSYRKQGNFVFYELADDEVSGFMGSLHRLSEKQLVQVQQIKKEFMSNQSEMEAVTLADLRRRIELGEIMLIDVRPRAEYDAAHIPGAVSIPIEELEEKLASLPTNCDVVAYCRGPYCLMSVEAVGLLQAKGFKAFRLEDSVQDWKEFVRSAE
jgi:rhodanese-related sulfurtransferase/predicted transcriptional regulator